MFETLSKKGKTGQSIARKDDVVLLPFMFVGVDFRLTRSGGAPREFAELLCRTNAFTWSRCRRWPKLTQSCNFCTFRQSGKFLRLLLCSKNWKVVLHAFADEWIEWKSINKRTV
ncbi:hypothetical protein T11_16256 [Trichinella zimbabwensis]|uniref:Uncharacterized protein n=1 Tax=Trichinella zimbabwensis TaxID=268475 RepID=A0A0V1HL21_9BILA|nr:hypothetical protein T11_16256 [Trichinella zimbabwensis]